MNSVRLLPVVMVAAGALLFLKLLGLVSGEGYVLSGSQPIFAQEAPQNSVAEDAQMEDSETDADESAAEMEGDEPEDAMPITLNKQGGIEQLLDSSNLADTERLILQSLSERRQQLDELEAKLKLQESIVRAAELRLETRAAELKQIEERIQQLVQRKEDQEDEQFASLVATYENMKPKDAARLFDRLDMVVLVRMVERMNPRKMASIMSAMDSEKAEALTINLANPNFQQSETVSGDDDPLPQIIGQ